MANIKLLSLSNNKKVVEMSWTFEMVDTDLELTVELDHPYPQGIVYLYHDTYLNLINNSNLSPSSKKILATDNSIISSCLKDSDIKVVIKRNQIDISFEVDVGQISEIFTIVCFRIVLSDGSS